MKKLMMMLVVLAGMSVGAVDEYSMRFWVKTPTLPAVIQPAETFELVADSAGKMTLTLFADPYSGAADYVAKINAVALEKGKFQHIALQYSRKLRYVAVYFEGKLVFSADGVLPPPMDTKGRYVKETKGVDVKEFSSFPEFLETEYLLMATDEQIEKGHAEAIKLAGDNQKAQSFASWYKFFKSANAKQEYNIFPLSRITEVRGHIEKALKAAAFSPKKFRLMCYNIHMGAGAEDFNSGFREGELRGLPRVARTIDEAGADMACMQEVHQCHGWTGHVDMPEYLKEQCAFESAVCTNGVMIMGRQTPKAVRVEKVGTSTLLMCDYGDYYLATSHFNVNPKLTDACAEESLKFLADPDKPVIFCGDLNLAPEASAIALLKTKMTMLSDPKLPTAHSLYIEAGKEGTCLDYFFVDTKHAASVRATNYRVGYGSSQASDHCPIYIDLEFN